MPTVRGLVTAMRRSPTSVRFDDLEKVCEHYFGKPRHEESPHKVNRTPWSGDSRVNVQNDKGMAKAYQVKQVLAAIEKITEEEK